MKQLCPALMPQTKCAIQQGFPNRPKGGRVTVCLTEREPAVGPALLSECHHGRPQGLPSCQSHGQGHDRAFIDNLLHALKSALSLKNLSSP